MGPQVVKATAKPMLKRHYRHVRSKRMVLYPEGQIVLNGPASEIIGLTDGKRDAEEIHRELQVLYDRVPFDDVESFFAENHLWFIFHT